MTKRSATHPHTQTHAAVRRGIAERGGWVDQQVASILDDASIPIAEKASRVYELLSAKPPGDHLPPIDVIRVRLARKFPELAEPPDGPLTPENMPGTLYLVLPSALKAWRPPTRKRGSKRGRNGNDGMASFITFLINRISWECSDHIARRMREGVEIPTSELLRLKDAEDGIDEDYVPDLGFESVAFEELL
jgi:hypothetical protein